MDLVIGYGEVGKGLKAIIPQATALDIGDKYEGEVGVMNITFGYSDSFVRDVQAYIELYKPELTIIHSTVPVGTTRKIGDIAYSFVRGKHPDLSEMLNYVRHVSAVNTKTSQRAAAYLTAHGFEVMIHETPEAVEFGKLFDTTYYGICIAAIKEFKRMADAYQVDWDDIAKINEAYNVGVRKKGKPEWVRPELQPTEGPIGGHCVVPNAKILHKDFDSKMLEMIEEAR